MFGHFPTNIEQHTSLEFFSTFFFRHLLITFITRKNIKRDGFQRIRSFPAHRHEFLFGNGPGKNKKGRTSWRIGWLATKDCWSASMRRSLCLINYVCWEKNKHNGRKASFYLSQNRRNENLDITYAYSTCVRRARELKGLNKVPWARCTVQWTAVIDSQLSSSSERRFRRGVCGGGNGRWS